MGRIKLAIIVLLVSMVVVPVFVACTQEKIVEVPVEKVVEKEVVKEVPVEKVVIKEVPVETGTIVLGMMGDFTGPYAVAATPMLKAAQDYVRYINEEGGINGNMLKLVWGEHGFAPPKMLTLYDKFMEDGAIQVSNMTVLESSVTKARHDEDKIPCTSAGVNTDMVANPAFQYSLIPIRVDQIGALADWIVDGWKEDRPPRLAILAKDDPGGREMLDPLAQDYAEKAGVEIVAEEVFPMQLADAKPHLLRAQEAEADFITGVFIEFHQKAFMRDADLLGIDAQFVGLPYHDIQVTRDLFPESHLSEGYTVAYIFEPWLPDSNIPGIKLMEEVQMKYRGEIDGNYFYETGWLLAMTNVECVRLALEEVGVKELDGAALQKHGFDRLSNYDMMGMAPPISFGPKGRVWHDKLKFYQIRGGEIVEASDWVLTPDVAGVRPK